MHLQLQLHQYVIFFLYFFVFFLKIYSLIVFFILQKVDKAKIAECEVGIDRVVAKINELLKIISELVDYVDGGPEVTSMAVVLKVLETSISKFQPPSEISTLENLVQQQNLQVKNIL